MKRTTFVREPYNLRQRKAKVFVSTLFYMSVSTKDMYRDSCREELQGIQELECFEVVYRSASEGQGLYRAVVVDKVKPDGSKKSRLCVTACNYQDRGLLTGAPTME